MVLQIKELQLGNYFVLTQKFNKRSMVRTITGETKREGQRKAKRHTSHRNPIKRERASHGRKLSRSLTTSLMSFACKS